MGAQAIATAVAGVFVVLSVWGFYWMNKTIVVNSYAFLSELDLTSLSGAAIAASCAALFVYILYMINYPEGQLARDAASAFRPPQASAKQKSS